MLKVYHTRSILLIILFTFLYNLSFARKFYFSSTTGNDSYSIAQAQNPATPWKTLKKLQTCVTLNNNVFQAGDTIAFKRGDVFANGHTAASGFDYVSCSWIYYPSQDYTAPSGTPNAPIVLTNYGDQSLPLPNFIFPNATTPQVGNTEQHNVFEFGGVSWIVLDGLMFDDYRFNAADKTNPAYTRSAILFGTWENTKFNGVDTIWGSNRDPNNRARMLNNCTVKNCVFNNISFAFGQIAGINCKITNNRITNLKSCVDTTGTYDVGAGAFEAAYGFNNEISYNYVKGAWAKSGRVSSTFGLLGVGIDIFCLKNSKIIYNTFIDCSGAWEIGNLDKYDFQSGAQYDTFAYNKVINCGQFGYVHGGATTNDPFAGNNRNLACWNNVVINNNSSRMSGPNFGSDIYNDGQSFNQWWFFRSPTKCPDNTLPVSNTTWSNPINPPYCNYGGHRSSIQYSTDVIKGNADTLVDSRNNIFYSTVGDQMIYDATRTKYKHRNNIYYIKGGFLNPTILGGTLSTGELQSTQKLFVDTSASHPEDWDLHLATNSPAINAGVATVITKDFSGVSVSGNPDAGIYEYSTTAVITPLNATSTNNPILCNGGNSTVTISATGGTAPYTGTGTYILSAGTYSYYVTDASGLRDTVIVILTQPTPIAISVTNGTITTPNGTTTVTVTATGGTPAYTYNIDGGTYQTSNVFNNIAAGNHIVNVKDANGCIGTNSFFINAPVVTPIIVTATPGTITCNGATTSVVVSASGGWPPYSGTGTFSNITAGTYTYSVTDALGTVQSTTITISQPSNIIASATSGTITSYGGTTTVTVTASGGTGTLNYKLNAGNYQTSNIFTGVVAGTHSISVKDANGCIKTFNITITQPAAPTLSVTATPSAILCSGGTSNVVVAATGGVSPYTGTGTFSALAGIRSYTVTDAQGTSQTVTITINEPSLINASATSGTIAVNGGTTTVTVTASGGTGILNYKLNTGTYQTSNIFTGVAAGTHSITVKDANSCTKTISITITQPNALVVTATPSAILCNGGTSSVVVAATGGVSPYTGTGTFSALAGVRSYTVTDAQGATQTTSITINEPSLINASATSGTISVYGGTTTVTATASGGTGTLSYKLNAGNYQTSNIFTGVAAGTHSIMVKDANSCTKTISITITQPNALVVTATPSAILCNGGTSSVVVAATGGVSPYTGIGTFSALAGVRSYTVTDAQGSTQTITITITEPSLINLTLSSGNIATVGGTTIVTATASGGTSAYSYKIDNTAYQTSNIFNGVIAGTHTVTVKDANGCTKSTNIILSQPAANLSASIINIGTINCNGATTTLTVTATGGTSPYSGTGTFTVSAGLNSFIVTDANGVSQTVSTTISQPSAITTTLTSGTITTNGGYTNLTINATGGVAPYLYSLDNSVYQSSNIFTPVYAGTHSTAVKDANGCITNNSTTITQPSADILRASAVSGTITCFGGSTIVTVTATGGRAPYSGVGNFSSTAGTRTYTVRDALGNTQTVSVVINQPTELVVNASPESQIFTAGGTTSVIVTASGGTGTYRYSLNGGPSQTQSIFSGVPAGNHYVTVVDVNGCVRNSTFTVDLVQNSGFNLNLLNKTDATCIGASDGSIKVIAGGGTAGYLYKLNSSGTYSTSNLFTRLRAGIYRVFAKDAVGNTTDILVIVNDGMRTCSTTGKSNTLILNTYPNPSTQYFNLTINSESTTDVIVEIIDINGRKVYQGKGKFDKTFRFGNEFKSGTYFVKVIQGEKTTTQKIIKL